jgi:predicted alpha/beta superfamily hydrolase
MPSIVIHVLYPKTENALIVLRTDHDWEKNVEPVAVESDGTDNIFRIETDRPWFYFKPFLVTGDETLASRTANYLAIMNVVQERHVHPHFHEDPAPAVRERIEIPSDIAEKHAFRVFTPPGYYENTIKRYPVLYMQDGPNLFFPQESFAGEHWRVPEMLTTLDSMNLVRKTVVVGIYPNERMDEYTKPGYGDYARFLVENLKPFIDSSYRTLTDPANTAVMGSSLGGVVSFFIAWQHPHVFGKTACMSSTFGFRDDLLERVQNEEKRPIQIYLDSGWPEDNYEATRTMRELLARRGYESGRDLLYFAFPQAIHNEREWAMRSHIPYQFFFGRSS